MLLLLYESSVPCRDRKVDANENEKKKQKNQTKQKTTETLQLQSYIANLQ